MKVLLRIIAVVCVLIALFLLYAVIVAMTSDSGARPGVAIGYVTGAVLLSLLAARMWRYHSRRLSRSL
jgi:hypothetical protein